MLFKYLFGLNNAQTIITSLVNVGPIPKQFRFDSSSDSKVRLSAIFVN